MVFDTHPKLSKDDHRNITATLFSGNAVKYSYPVMCRMPDRSDPRPQPDAFPDFPFRPTFAHTKPSIPYNSKDMCRDEYGQQATAAKWEHIVNHLPDDPDDPWLQKFAQIFGRGNYYYMNTFATSIAIQTGVSYGRLFS